MKLICSPQTQECVVSNHKNFFVFKQFFLSKHGNSFQKKLFFQANVFFQARGSCQAREFVVSRQKCSLMPNERIRRFGMHPNVPECVPTGSHGSIRVQRRSKTLKAYENIEQIVNVSKKCLKSYLNLPASMESKARKGKERKGTKWKVGLLHLRCLFVCS